MNASDHNNVVQDQPDHLFYLESSVAPGLTLNEYRRGRRRPTRWDRLKQLAGGAQGGTAQLA